MRTLQGPPPHPSASRAKAPYARVDPVLRPASASRRKDFSPESGSLRLRGLLGQNVWNRERQRRTCDSSLIFSRSHENVSTVHLKSIARERLSASSIRNIGDQHIHESRICLCNSRDRDF